jgi:iron complex outermembrane receptor protein
VLRGFIEPFAADPNSLQGSGANVSGTQIEANPVLRTDPLNIEGDLQVYGFNATFDISDNWSVMLDAAHSQSTKRDQRAESYAGLARSGTLSADQLGTRQFQMSNDGVFFTGSSGLAAFSDPSLLQLTGPQVWGGGLASLESQFATDLLRPNGDPYTFLNAQDGFNNFADFEEELTTVRLEAQHFIDGDIFTDIKFGVNYSDRYKDKVNKGFFATHPSYFNDSLPNSTNVPDNYVFGLANLNWAGLGNVVAYDGFAPYNDGTYILNDAGFLEPDRLGDTYVVEEEVITLYFQANFDTEFMGRPLVGNIGVQYIDTDQSSTGFIGIIGPNFRACDANNDEIVDADCETSGGAQYSHTLPSLNLSWEFADDQYLRFGANKTISRARIDQMQASAFVKFDQNIQFITIPNSEQAVREFGSPWSKAGGNPELRPLESNNFDLSYEYYFADEGYISAAFFYKDLVNWTLDAGQLIDFTNDPNNGGANYFIPGFHDRVIDVAGFYGPAGGTFFDEGDLATPPDFGFESTFTDGLTGSVEGIEITALVPFGIFSEYLEGFGIAGSATFIDSELDGVDAAGNPLRIPGQSDEVYSLTFYYENEGFEFRVAGTDRSDFVTYERGGSNKIAEATRQGVTLVDAQISYDFSGNTDIEWLEGLRVSLQGTNLTDVDEETQDDVFTDVVRVRRQFGPTYLLNFNYSFY